MMNLASLELSQSFSMSLTTERSGIESTFVCGPGLGFVTQWLVFLGTAQLLGAVILFMCFFIALTPPSA